MTVQTWIKNVAWIRCCTAMPRSRRLALITLALLPSMAVPLAAAADTVLGKPGDGGIITVRPSASMFSKQKLQQFVGISGANSGAKGLFLNRVVIPPGATARAHRHLGSESAIYITRARC